MDGSYFTLSQVSQTGKDKHHMILLICGVFKKGTNELTYKAEIVTDIENKFMVTRGLVGMDNWNIGIDIYTILYIKQITNNYLLYSTGNCSQYSVMNGLYRKPILKRINICVYI